MINNPVAFRWPGILENLRLHLSQSRDNLLTLFKPGAWIWAFHYLSEHAQQQITAYFEIVLSLLCPWKVFFFFVYFLFHSVAIQDQNFKPDFFFYLFPTPTPKGNSLFSTPNLYTTCIHIMSRVLRLWPAELPTDRKIWWQGSSDNKYGRPPLLPKPHRAGWGQVTPLWLNKAGPCPLSPIGPNWGWLKLPPCPTLQGWVTPPFPHGARPQPLPPLLGAGMLPAPHTPTPQSQIASFHIWSISWIWSADSLDTAHPASWPKRLSSTVLN